MKSLFALSTVVIAALLIGIGSASVAVRTMHPVVKNGALRTSLTTGSTEAGLHERARVAIFALLALNKTEALYFIADVDSAGAALEPRCDYRIEGRDVDARWWSITAYAGDFFLIDNPASRYSYNMANVQREPNGRFIIRLSRSEKQGNWLPTGRASAIRMCLRLYEAAPAILEDPGAVSLPSILRDSCS